MNYRIEKVNENIKKIISEIISRSIEIKPGIFLTVSKVDTSKDLRYTQVFISIFPESESEYAIKTLEKEIYKIQGILNKKLSTKPLPKIEFKLDLSEYKADEVEKLFNKIREEND